MIGRLYKWHKSGGGTFIRARLATTYKLFGRVHIADTQRQNLPGRGRMFRYMHQQEDGATAIEYALIIGLAALAIAGGLGAIAELVQLLFELLRTNVSENAPTAAGD